MAKSSEETKADKILWKKNNREKGGGMTDAQRLKKNAAAKLWRDAHPDKLSADRAQYYLKNKEKVKARNTEYRHKNPEKQKVMHAKWRSENADHIRHTHRSWYNANKDNVNAKLRANGKIIRDQVFTLLGEVCSHCGFADRRALQIDHVNGGGTKELRSLGSAVNKKILSCNGAGYQILCANCNWIKRYTHCESNAGGELPPFGFLDSVAKALHECRGAGIQ